MSMQAMPLASSSSPKPAALATSRLRYWALACWTRSRLTWSLDVMVAAAVAPVPAMAATSPKPMSLRSMGGVVLSEVEVRIEDAHLRDGLDGQSVALGGTADGLGGGSVAHAERRAAVVAHVGVDPRHAVIGVRGDHGADRIRAAVVGRDVEPVREPSLDEVAGHDPPPFPAGGSGLDG